MATNCQCRGEKNAAAKKHVILPEPTPKLKENFSQKESVNFWVAGVIEFFLPGMNACTYV